MSTFNPARTPSTARIARYRVRQALGRCPSVYLPLARLRNARQRLRHVVGPGVELVIEGFPRSANTFAVTAFRCAQRRPVDVAHHVHLPVQVLYGIRHDIPTLVLIREPVGAIVSYMLHTRYPGWSPIHALKEYLRFYETLLPYRERFVIGRFDEVVGDFGTVVRRVNGRFGAGFVPFEHTPANVAACFAEIDAMNRQRRGGRLCWSDLTRPDARRDQAKAAARARLRSPEFAAPLARAQALYEEFCDS
ncbi:MAG: hypothetical protein ACODAQ_07770 [Phycisphaeraceae bacterium]